MVHAGVRQIVLICNVFEIKAQIRKLFYWHVGKKRSGDATTVFSYWIYFLARLPTTSGPVGWGLCGCDAACTLAPADAWSAPRSVGVPGLRLF